MSEKEEDEESFSKLLRDLRESNIPKSKVKCLCGEISVEKDVWEAKEKKAFPTTTTTYVVDFVFLSQTHLSNTHKIPTEAYGLPVENGTLRLKL